MARIAKQTVPTKEVMDAFYRATKRETNKRIRSQIDREEVYEYEKKIGKQLFEMDCDELFEMMRTFGSKRKTMEGPRRTNINSFFQLSSMYRALFNYYIDNYNVIKNPFNDPRMKSNKGLDHLMENSPRFTQKDVDDLINRIQSDLPEERANYVECIIRLFCEGFSTNEEIVLLRENMINFRKRQVKLLGRTVQLSERTLYLLNYVHSLKKFPANHGEYEAVQYKDYYFKYSVFPRNVKDFNDKDPKELTALISRVIVNYVRRPYNADVSYRDFFLLGFYRKLVDTYGEERTNQMLASTRNASDTYDIFKVAEAYGVNTSNISTLKKSMRFYY